MTVFNELFEELGLQINVKSKNIKVTNIHPYNGYNSDYIVEIEELYDEN